MKKLRNWLAMLGIGICLFTAAVPAAAVYAATEPTYEYTELTAQIEAYVGQVNTDGLNVRTGCGASYEQVKYNGKNVVLNKGDKVAIMSVAKSSEGNDWYEIRWINNGVEYNGYVRGKYVTKSEERAVPLPTPTPEATPTPEVTPTPTPEPTLAPEISTPMPTEVPKTPSKENSGGFSIGKGLGIIVLLLIIAAAVYAYLFLKKREKAGAETSEKIDSLKNIQLKKSQESENNYAINVMKRRQELPEEPADAPAASSQQKGYEAEAAILARKEHARIINQEIMEKSRFYDPYEEKKKEDELKQLSESLKEKELLREEIENLRPGDLVYHEYFGKGVVFDNSDVKRIEIRFGTDVRFVDKSACVAKKIMKKV